MTSPSPSKPRARKKSRATISLSQAVNYFRVPGSGNHPTRSLLIYHMNTKRLKPDKRVPLPAGGFVYGFSRSTLQAFARVVGWAYCSPEKDEA